VQYARGFIRGLTGSSRIERVRGPNQSGDGGCVDGDSVRFVRLSGRSWRVSLSRLSFSCLTSRLITLGINQTAS
jgi:hypothetical protein